MLIVIEGADGVGKTTLAHDLAAAVNAAGGAAEYRHLSAPVRHPLEETVLDLDGYRPGAGATVIYDRHALGEAIYGPRLRDRSLLGEVGGPQLRYVDMYLRSRGALLLHVTARIDVAKKRLLARGDDVISPGQLPDLLAAFEEAAVGALCEAVTLQVPCTLGYTLKRAARHEADVQGVFAVTDRWLGDPRPRVLYVGDETSPAHGTAAVKRPEYRAPFVPYENSSGYYLFEALPVAALDRAAVVNANEVPLRETYDVLGQPESVIAFGQRAATRLDRAKIPHRRTAHPQHVRRFFHARLGAWGEHVLALSEGREETWR